jgi:hypothetical protein
LHWTVLHRHDDHQHGWLELDGAGGSFRVPDFGEEDHAFELRLTATDSTGLANVAVVVVPIEATLFADDFEYGQLAKWNPTQP